MKERLALTLSWAALINFAFLWATVGYTVFMALPAQMETMLGDEDFWLMLVASPTMWLTLWILTGSARILPWRRPPKTSSDLTLPVKRFGHPDK